MIGYMSGGLLAKGFTIEILPIRSANRFLVVARALYMRKVGLDHRRRHSCANGNGIEDHDYACPFN